MLTLFQIGKDDSRASLEVSRKVRKRGRAIDGFVVFDFFLYCRKQHSEPALLAVLDRVNADVASDGKKRKFPNTFTPHYRALQFWCDCALIAGVTSPIPNCQVSSIDVGQIHPVSVVCDDD